MNMLLGKYPIAIWKCFLKFLGEVRILNPQLGILGDHLEPSCILFAIYPFQVVVRGRRFAELFAFESVFQFFSLAIENLGDRCPE